MQSLGDRKTALVTGASSGIGNELVKIFAREGYNVVLVARNQGALETLAKELQTKHSISAVVVPADLSDRSTPGQIREELAKESVPVDYLVNNAGFQVRGLFQEADLKMQLSMMQVNMIALVNLTRLFIDDMVKKGDGGILNLASTAAFLPGPLMAVYYATKAFVLSFSQALADELRDTGVKVTALCPGPTRTEFASHFGTENSRLFKGAVMDPETVALAGFEGLIKGKRVVVPGIRNRTLTTVTRLIPSRFLIPTVRKLNEDSLEN
jgi:short-subunit dehydrogenase